MKTKFKVLYNSGEPVVLSPAESRIANHFETRIKNELGHEVDITTLTHIVKAITEQKFFEIAPADYVPIKVGNGAWNTQLTTFRSFHLAEDFETGLINTGANNARMASADAGVDAITVPILNWAKQIGWTIFDIQMAAQSGNWDLVTAKEEARKKNWDLGIQRVAFLGSRVRSDVYGLLTLPGITPDTSRITKFISTMSEAELKTFTAGVIDDYRKRVNHTAWPTHFVIPESDYVGLASPASDTFPVRTTLDLLLEVFRITTKNPEFQILPCAYANASLHPSGKSMYALYRYDEKSVRMDIPVDYTNTLANTLEGFSYQNAAYGQFTGVTAYRPLEVLYYQIPS